jgi:hypothetical protein
MTAHLPCLDRPSLSRNEKAQRAGLQGVPLPPDHPAPGAQLSQHQCGISWQWKAEDRHQWSECDKRSQARKWLKKLAGTTRLELATSAVTEARLTVTD